MSSPIPFSTNCFQDSAQSRLSYSAIFGVLILTCSSPNKHGSFIEVVSSRLSDCPSEVLFFGVGLEPTTISRPGGTRTQNITHFWRVAFYQLNYQPIFKKLKYSFLNFYIYYNINFRFCKGLNFTAFNFKFKN